MSLSNLFGLLTLNSQREAMVYPNIYTRDIAIAIKSILMEEDALLDGSFYQYYLVGDILYDAIMMALMEIKHLDNFCNFQYPDHQVVLKTFQNDAVIFRRKMVYHVASLRAAIQTWIMKKPIGTCRNRFKSYIEKLHPAMQNASTNIEDWIVVLGSQLYGGKKFKIISRIREIFGEEVIVPIFDDFMHVFE